MVLYDVLLSDIKINRQDKEKCRMTVPCYRSKTHTGWMDISSRWIKDSKIPCCKNVVIPIEFCTIKYAVDKHKVRALNFFPVVNLRRFFTKTQFPTAYYDVLEGTPVYIGSNITDVAIYILNKVFEHDFLGEHCRIVDTNGEFVLYYTDDDMTWTDDKRLASVLCQRYQLMLNDVLTKYSQYQSGNMQRSDRSYVANTKSNGNQHSNMQLKKKSNIFTFSIPISCVVEEKYGSKVYIRMPYPAYAGECKLAVSKRNVKRVGNNYEIKLKAKPYSVQWVGKEFNKTVHGLDEIEFEKLSEWLNKLNK